MHKALLSHLYDHLCGMKRRLMFFKWPSINLSSKYPFKLERRKFIICLDGCIKHEVAL